MALNARQRRFVDLYLLEPNATKAALDAGYSKETAYSQGSRLLKKVEVKKLIEKNENFERAKLVRKSREKGITKEWWIARLYEVANANMDDHAKVVQTNIGKKKSNLIVQDVIATPTGERPRRLGRAIKKLTPTKHGVAVELHSRDKALEQIGRAMGWLTSDMNLNLPESGVNVNVTMPSNGREAPEPVKTDDEDEEA